MKTNFKLSVAGFVSALIGVMLLASFSNEPASAGTPQPDAAVDKVATDTTVDFGDPVEFTITVTNVGSGDVGGFHLEDTLPAGGISWTIDPGGFDSCTPNPADTNFVCDRAEVLHEGEGLTVTLTGDSSELDCPEGEQLVLTNNVGVDSVGDNNPLNDGDSAVITVTCPPATTAADAAVDKVATDTTVDFGDPVEFTITVTNVGSGDVGGFHLEDTLPAGGISWTIDPGGFDSCTPNPADTNFVCDRAEVLHEGEGLTVTLTGDSSELDCPEGEQLVLTNNVGVDSVGDNNPLNDGDSAVITVTCPPATTAADAAVDKVATDTTVDFGDPVEFTITVTNVGSGDVGGFHLEDTLPAGGISWTIDPGGFDSCTPNPADTNFVCDRAEVLHEGEGLTVTLTGDSSELDCPEGEQLVLTNNVGVDSVGDNNPLNDGDSAVITVTCPLAGAADAALDKVATDTTVNFGDTVEFTITVTNVGSGDVGGFHLEDTLPLTGAGITWQLNPVGWDQGCSTPTTSPPFTFTCDRDEVLHEGESITLIITGDSGDLDNCPDGEQVVLVNNAGVITEGDTNALNDGDSAVVTVTCPLAGAADAALDKVATDTTVNFGDTVEFTITVTNVGSGDVGGFHLEDTLPLTGAGITWQLNPVGWDQGCSTPTTSPPFTFTCDRDEVLHEGESITLIITGDSGDLDNCPDGEQVVLVNNAGVITEGDTNALNDGDSAVVTVTCPLAGAADAALDKVATDTTVNFGDTVEFTITVTNVGSGDVGGFHLEDTLPLTGAGITWQLNPVGWDQGCSTPTTSPPFTFTCDRDEVLHEGESITLIITGDSGDLDNCPDGEQVVLVNNAGVITEGDTNALNDGDSAVVTVTCPLAGAADAALDKVATDTTVNFGDTVEFTITVTNVGSGDVGGFHLEDTLPLTGAGITWQLNPVGWDQGCSTPTTSPPFTFTCDRDEVLHEGESITLIITGDSGDLDNCPDGEQVVLVNNAGVITEGDTNALNDGDSAVVTVTCPLAGAADAALDKVATDTTVNFGDTVEFTITVTNVGSGDVGGFHLEDTLPLTGAGITWQLNPVGWDQGCSTPTTSPPFTFTCDRDEVLHEGESITLIITGDSGDLDNCPDGEQVVLVNNAGVITEGDTNALNDGDSAVVTVTCPLAGAADAALDKVATDTTVNFGDTVEFTITVTNVGSGDVGGFHLEDTLPLTGAGITWQLNPVGWDQGCSTPTTSPPFTFTCDRDEVLHEGESITLIITGDSGDLDNCPDGEQVVLVNNAGVITEGDTNALNDGDSAVVTVTCPEVGGAGTGSDGSGTAGTPSGPTLVGTGAGAKPGDSTGTSNVAGVRGGSGGPQINTGGGVAGMDSDGAWSFGLGALMAAMVGASALGLRRAIS